VMILAAILPPSSGLPVELLALYRPEC
jgi:hypothetical protein